MFASRFHGAMQPWWPAVEVVRRSSGVHRVQRQCREMLNVFGGPRLMCAVCMEHTDRLRGEYHALAGSLVCALCIWNSPIPMLIAMYV
jgi:hypothetical protein